MENSRELQLETPQDKFLYRLRLIPSLKVWNIEEYLISNFSNIRGSCYQKFSFKKKQNSYNIELIYPKPVNINTIHNNFGSLFFLESFKLRNCIKVKNFDFRYKNHDEALKIQNYFSSYGNVNEVIFFKNNSNIIINFQFIKAIIVSKKYTNGLEFNNKFIKIRFHKYFKFKENKHIKFIIKQKYFRYKIQKYRINTPNNKLFFFFFKKIKLSEFFFEVQDKFKANKVLISKQKKYSVSYIVIFPNQTIAIKALMHFHNKLIHNILVKVSFTH